MPASKTIKPIVFLILFSLFFGFSPVMAEEADKVYVLTLSYQNNEISLVNVFAKQGFAPDKRVQPENGYEYRIVSSSNKTLYSFKFTIPSELTLFCSGCGGNSSCGSGCGSGSCNSGCGGGTVDSKSSEVASLANTQFTLLAPFYKEAKAINIYDQSAKLKLTVDVSQLQGTNAKKSAGFYLGISLIFLGALVVIAAVAYRVIFKKTPATPSTQ